uniref:PH domain-containing protein n=1 Tax=Anopheles merus TaxID=30066 RepID=A0A182V2Z5_ANOME
MMHSSSSAASTPAKDQHQPGTPLDGTSMAGMNATPSGTPSATPGTTTGGGSSSSAGVSGSGAGRASSLIIPKALNVVLHGYHRKHKTNKKKYFVVYGDVPGKAARLEYFDSEKKFKQSFQKGNAGCDGGTQPKRTIVLRTCFNINKRHDLKKQIISLYTKDDSFCIVFESEEELNLWLRTLLRLQRGEDSEGDPPRPTFVCRPACDTRHAIYEQNSGELLSSLCLAMTQAPYLHGTTHLLTTGYETWAATGRPLCLVDKGGTVSGIIYRAIIVIKGGERQGNKNSKKTAGTPQSWPQNTTLVVLMMMAMMMMMMMLTV